MNDIKKELIKLISENPDLPVIPIVNTDVVAEDWGWWLGEFVNVTLGELIIYNKRWYTNRLKFLEAYCDDHLDELCNKFKFNPEMERLHNICGQAFTEEELLANQTALEALEYYIEYEIANKFFIKAILLYINVTNDNGLKSLELKN